MTAEVITLRDAQAESGREAMLSALAELHSLITIDPVMGASPVRIYFVLNPAVKSRIAAFIDAEDRGYVRPPGAYALISYDFPFALHLVETSARQMASDRAKAVVTSSAELQGYLLQSAASALGVEAQAAPDFDADALKAVFFPNTEETVTHVFRLELTRERARARTLPAAPLPLSGEP
jgi:hypothetical protein